MKSKITYLECKCSCPDHTIKFCLDHGVKDWPPELFVYTQLRSCDSFFKRCWYAVKYIFKKEMTYSHWDETLIKGEDVDKISNILTEYKIMTEYFTKIEEVKEEVKEEVEEVKEVSYSESLDPVKAWLKDI